MRRIRPSAILYGLAVVLALAALGPLKDCGRGVLAELNRQPPPSAPTKP